MSSREGDGPPASRPAASRDWGGVLSGERALLLSVAVGAALLCLIALDASPLLRGPSPAPSGWRWPQRESLPTVWSGLAFACGGGLLGLLYAAGRERERADATFGAFLLLSAAALGFGLQWGLLELSREGGAIRALINRTMSPDFTSYYTAAVSPIARDVPAFIDAHARLVVEAPAGMLHFATHPPGAVLFYRAQLWLCEVSPGLTALLGGWAGTAGYSAEQGSEAILATALLAPLFLMWLAALSCWPVTALAAAAGADRAAARRIGITWLAVPGVALMHPEIDQLVMFTVVAALALLARSIRAPIEARAGFATAALAGLTAGLAIFLSHGAVAFMAIGGLAVLAMGWGSQGSRPRALMRCLLAAAVALCVQLVPIAWGYDLIESMTAALEIHRERFTAPRSYWAWLLFNFWDFAVLLGLALFGLGCWRTALAARQLSQGHGLERLVAADRLLLVLVIGLVLLDLTGTVRGETGRIWIPMMAPIAAATLAGWAGRAAPRRAAPPAVSWLLLCGALLVSSWVLRISWEIP